MPPEPDGPLGWPPHAKTAALHQCSRSPMPRDPPIRDSTSRQPGCQRGPLPRHPPVPHPHLYPGSAHRHPARSTECEDDDESTWNESPNCFYSMRARYPQLTSPLQIYSPPRQIPGREPTRQVALASGGDCTAPATPAVWLRLPRNSQRKICDRSEGMRSLRGSHRTVLAVGTGGAAGGAVNQEQLDLLAGHCSAGKIPRTSQRPFHCWTRDGGIEWWVLALFLARWPPCLSR